MGDFQSYQQVVKDALKRKYIDFFKRGGRLTTPMSMLISILKAQSYLPREMIALELFGMHGLWNTKDYANLCAYLEVYEINRVYAKCAKLFLKNAIITITDSIQAVKNGQLKRSRYNFIVSDNPFSSPYGNGYCEHFDLFPAILDYVDEGILQLSFCHNIENLRLCVEHLNRREKFYGKANPTVKEAVEAYRKLMARAELVDYILVPKSDELSNLALVLRGRPVQPK